MRKIFIFFIMFISFSLSCFKFFKQSDSEEYSQKLSYIVGYNMAKKIRDEKLILDKNTFIEGVKDCLFLKDMKYTNEEALEIIKAYDKEKRKTLLKNNLDKGKKTFNTNKLRSNITTLSSGLQYKILSKGTGRIPTIDDLVQIKYKGFYLDGREFDSSYKYGNEPAIFPLKQVIKGWQEALTRMHEGDKWLLYIRPELAFGIQGTEDLIEPGATLIYEIKLIRIE